MYKGSSVHLGTEVSRSFHLKTRNVNMASVPAQPFLELFLACKGGLTVTVRSLASPLQILPSTPSVVQINSQWQARIFTKLKHFSKNQKPEEIILPFQTSHFLFKESCSFEKRFKIASQLTNSKRKIGDIENLVKLAWRLAFTNSFIYSVTAAIGHEWATELIMQQANRGAGSLSLQGLLFSNTEIILFNVANKSIDNNITSNPFWK